MYVSTAIIRAIVGELDRVGISSASVIEASGVDPRIVSDSTGAIAIPDYIRFVEETLARTSDPLFGLKAGWRSPTGATNVIGYVLVNSKTLREALVTYTRYSRLVIEDADWSFVDHPTEARFGFVHPTVPDAVARFEAEFILAYALCRVGLHFVGPKQELITARFAHPEPRWSEGYRRVFGTCPIEFGADRNELIFDAEYLDIVQPNADAWMGELLQQRADALLRERQSEDRLRARVKDVLKYQLPRGSTHSGEVARAVGLTPRTMRRRLSELGCTLRELQDECRKEIACSGILSPKRSIKDIAYELGFAEPSAFHRAFKRWTGLTPQQYRARNADVAES